MKNTYIPTTEDQRARAEIDAEILLTLLLKLYLAGTADEYPQPAIRQQVASALATRGCDPLADSELVKAFLATQTHITQKETHR